MVAQVASEQEKQQLLPLVIHASTPAHCFQNDGVKKGWGGRGIRGAQIQSSSSLSILKEARWHKQCAERVCCIVVAVVVVAVAVVAVVVFGWGANEWNERGNEFHQWPVHNEKVLFE
jgi:hypothetical protein